ncbi:hypothetical protein MVEG_09955 [Podila verticillata NRRL 6337]|nr:hypothetical protein MVEG_09955 [Podila verticillata NRRL 6337]
MREGILFLLIFLWLLSGDDAPRTDYLQKILHQLHDEADMCANKTFRTNMTYPIPEAVSAELTSLFDLENKRPRMHYYHNVTGSFKGTWSYDKDITAMIDTELPLPPAPPEAKNGTDTDGGAKLDGVGSGEGGKEQQEDRGNNSTIASPGSNNTTDPEPGTIVAEEPPLDTIIDKKPKYLEDVTKNRGLFDFNKSGSFMFNIRESKATEQVNLVSGTWRLKHDDNEDFGISLQVQGVHFVNNGSFYMWGIPEDARMPLSHILDLMPNNSSFIMAAAALKEQYLKRIKRVENVMHGYENLDYPETTMSEPSSCHYQMYMQLGGIDSSVRSTSLKELEREMATPQGISTIKAPHLNSTLFMYSPNCRIAIGIKDGEGMKREKFFAKAVNYAGMAGTIAFIQVFLLVRQMEYTPTPSSVSKVSYWTIAMQVFMDSYLCMLHLTTGILVDFLFIPFVAASFFSFVLVAMFGMRYMLVIWRIQRPERRGRRNRAAAAAAASANNSSTGSSTGVEATAATATNRPTDTMPGGLPLPVTATRPAAPEPDSPRSDMQALYGRFYWMLIASLVTLYKIAISSTRVQNLMISACALLLFSFWIPQIVRNVIRGSKRGLSLWFVLGMTVTRLVLPIYFYACPENLMGHEPTKWIWGLVLWVALQVAVLLLQDWLGPRFFIPKKYLPPIYDYHPIIPAGDEESGQSITGHTHGHQQDCAICMLPIDTASTSGHARLSSVVGSLGRLNYMLTPCGHLFHSDCLERWMRIKLECPNCRAFLPST